MPNYDGEQYWVYGATVARLTPEQKVESLNLSNQLSYETRGIGESSR